MSKLTIFCDGSRDGKRSSGDVHERVDLLRMTFDGDAVWFDEPEEVAPSMQWRTDAAAGEGVPAGGRAKFRLPRCSGCGVSMDLDWTPRFNQALRALAAQFGEVSAGFLAAKNSEEWFSK